jgi:hypothetical protein
MKNKLILLPKNILLVPLVAVFLLLAPGDASALGNFDDCGTLRLTGDGCLVFAPDHHPGVYTLDNSGGFGPGDRVHVIGNHDSNYYCSCQSRCIRQNTIVEGCSTLCSALTDDANNDGRMNIADVGVIISLIFTGGDALTCPEQGDCNNNGRIDIGDVTCLIAKIF